MALTLCQRGQHTCQLFADLIAGDQDVQANHFLIVDRGDAILLEPSGQRCFAALEWQLERVPSLRNWRYVFAPHQDPDTIGSAEHWLINARAMFVISNMWHRFVPYLVSRCIHNEFDDRIVGIPNRGARLLLGKCALILLPAHFLHSAANLSCCDPVSKTRYSGDIGASIGADHLGQPVADFSAHRPGVDEHLPATLQGQSARAAAVSRLVWEPDIVRIVPQHGKRCAGRDSAAQFLD